MKLLEKKKRKRKRKNYKRKKNNNCTHPENAVEPYRVKVANVVANEEALVDMYCVPVLSSLDFPEYTADWHYYIKKDIGGEPPGPKQSEMAMRGREHIWDAIGE